MNTPAMRRADRQISAPAEIEAVLSHATECHLALVDAGEPYGVTLNFAYEKTPAGVILYFHCAHEGRKLACLRAHPNAYFFAEAKTQFIERHQPDGAAYFSMLYESVAGTGRIEEVLDAAEKRRTLGLLAARFTSTPMAQVPEASIRATTVLKMPLATLTGKRH